jgi:hypothetical protein
MKIQITRPGGPWPTALDGIHAVLIEDGKEYDFPADIGKMWVGLGWAKKPGEAQPIEDKMIVVAPETKAITPEPIHIDIAWEPEPPVTKPHKTHKRGRK